MLIRTILIALLLSAATTVSAVAQDFMLDDLTINHPWARASIGQVPNGAAYMTITNQGPQVDRLLAADSPAAKHASLHTHLMDAGVMKMRPVEAIEVNPGEPSVLQPGGLHIMLLGLKAPLTEGQSFPLTLTFERAGTIEVEVRIQGVGAMEPATEHKHGS